MEQKTILVVDDSPTIRKLVGFILRKHGFAVLEAENGIHALEVMVRETVHLVVTDINMPKMDGLTLICEIRNDEQYKEVPVIILTTEQGEDDRAKGLSIGANIYLVKPTQPDILIEKVQGLLNRETND